MGRTGQVAAGDLRREIARAVSLEGLSDGLTPILRAHGRDFGVIGMGVMMHEGLFVLVIHGERGGRKDPFWTIADLRTALVSIMEEGIFPGSMTLGEGKKVLLMIYGQLLGVSSAAPDRRRERFVLQGETL
jgi:hypothetical protein